MEEYMLTRSIRLRFLTVLLLLIAILPAWAGGGSDANLKGMDITIGNWWEDYDVNTWKPRSDYEERELEHRKRIQQEYGFRIRVKQIASWEQISQLTAISIMSGKPAADVIALQPNWVMMLHGRKLLYPVTDNRLIDLTKSEPAEKGLPPLEWNQSTLQAFSFGGKSYAFSIGYGTSDHAQIVCFNKRLFREAGLDPNLPYDMQKNGTWTWANFIDICKKLTRDINNDGIIDTYAMTADLSTEILDAIVSSNGANYIDREPSGKFVNATNRPEFLEALQFAMRLKTEGILMPRPEISNWDWYQSQFIDGKVAFRIEPQYIARQLVNMRDDWGMVLFPKGPKAKDYTVYTDENVFVIPGIYKQDQVERILHAVRLWYTPLDDNWKAGLYHIYRDTRAVDETIAMIRNPKYQVWKYHLFIPGLERGDIAWAIWWFEGEPAQLIESVSQSWNALINDANGIK
jgi:ABC-type glycerol-3-phosphate transport system substrate-binding protein